MKKSTVLIKLKSVNYRILAIYIVFLLKVLSNLNISFNFINIPKKIKKITLLKAAHVYKKAREQFELTLNQKVIQIKSSISNNILNLLLINKPKGVKFILKSNFNT